MQRRIGVVEFERDNWRSFGPVILKDINAVDSTHLIKLQS